jgi:hypothetical protein
LRSILGYLKDFHNIDEDRPAVVARGITKLCEEFKRDYRGVFPEGYQLPTYQDDPDSFNLISKVQILTGWSAITSHPFVR